MAQGVDASGSKISIIDICMHTVKHVINNNISVNFNQGYINILPAIIPATMFVATAVCL
jgi:hypothetical protein